MIKSSRLSLFMVVLFAISVIMPGSVFAAEDNTSISGSYEYVEAGDEVFCGVVRAVYDEWEDGTQDITVQLTLPDGVEFSDEPSTMAWVGDQGTKINSGSSYFEAEFNGVDTAFNVEFNFGYDEGTQEEYDSGDVALDIDDDFSGNLEVSVEVIGQDGDGAILWADSADVTIAKVSGGEVDVVVGDNETIAIGDEEVADITLEEATAGAISKNEWIFLEIDTDGVEFESLTVNETRVDVSDGNYSRDDAGIVYDENASPAQTYYFDKDFKKFAVQVQNVSEGLPGDVMFENIKLQIDPDVSGEIEMSVWSEVSEDVEDESVVVATVKDSEITVTSDEDTGMEEYMRITAIGELWELTLESSGEFEDGDKITVTLPDNFEFYKKAVENLPVNDSNLVDSVGTYNGDQSLWLEVNANGDGEDEIDLKNLFVAALPGAKYGDINVEIGGDVGTATAKAGFLKPAVMIKPEQTYVVAPGYGQPAGNITFTETDDDAVFDGMNLHMVLSNGVEFASTPTVKVNGEEIDEVRVGPDEYGKDVCQFTVDNSRSSKIDTLVVSDIKYDVESWFTAGTMINVSLGGNDPKLGDTFNKLYESYLAFADKGLEGPPADPKYWDNFQFNSEADEEIIAIPNAIVVDADQVKVSFTVGDEGVYVENGRTLVQVNLLSEALGLQKSWDSETKTAYFVKDGKTVAFPIGQNKVTVGKADLPVDQGAKIIDGNTCVTLRGLEMAFGGKLTWNGETKTATFVFNK